ncbi:hypothetical protein TVAG_278020 [Trichomonas vaginalis G3]|uniref:Uncharacterized protein n=1 Tax=Trichomonas vaginalis (strain ATCC PRA-98 / G3) TaxID=412133 RepID=A2DU43_TRIV3|nr:hypothetical protein TVAGG3_0438830 [Trichomonas vaginalis G3]EAY16036.1 hypothetical protein TVAG_278020 [Trichomonas vaginalis G3]KAI5537303.1 hypothetical protein TVAGG3_0438830 [Trichomonas vaginalis G3]|eukprot:XP_001328259.1 hypothetical protein [Trichomonas vaginalis G3]
MRGYYNYSNRRYPQSARVPKQNKRLPPMDNSAPQQNNEITYEEIRVLQLKKENLLNENRDLMEKIERTKDMMQNPDIYPEMQQYCENAKREAKKLDSVIEERKLEYQNHLNSDVTHEISELQTQLSIINDEIIRQKEMKKNYDGKLKEITDQLNNLQSKITDETIHCQDTVITDLNRRINIQEKRNTVLLKKLQEIRDSKEIDDECDVIAQREIDLLNSQISKEEQEIEQIEQEIKELSSHELL